MSQIEISKKIVLINTASSAVTLVLNFSVLIWLQQYLLKRISPEEYSLLPVLMSIIAFAPLATMFITQGLGRYTTVAYAKGDDAEVDRIYSTMFPILCATGVAILVIGWLGAWHIDALVEIAPELVTDAQIMMALLVFSVALRITLSLFNAGFIVTQKMMLQDMIDVGCQLIRIIILFSLLFGVSTQVIWVVVATVVADVINFTVGTIVSLRIFPIQRNIKLPYFRMHIAKELTSYGGWGFLQNIADTIKQSFDPLILNRFSSAVDVSVFYVGGIAARQLRMLLTPLTRPFIPIFAALCATEDFTKLRNTYLRLTRYHLWLILGITVPAIIFSDEVMHLYLDGKYDEAGLIMAMLLIVTVLNTFNSIGPGIVMAAGQVKELSLRYLFVQIVNFILTIFLVVYLQQGAFGSAIATLIAVAIFESMFYWPFCRRVAHTPTSLWISEVVLPCIGSALPSLVFCLIVKLSVGVDTWVDLILVSLASGILHFLMVMFVGLRQQDRIDISRISERLSGPTKKVVQYFGIK